MEFTELELDGSHEFGRYKLAWWCFVRIVCVCGWQGRARWPSARGLDCAADELIDHQIELCSRPPRS